MAHVDADLFTVSDRWIEGSTRAAAGMGAIHALIIIVIVVILLVLAVVLYVTRNRIFGIIGCRNRHTPEMGDFNDAFALDEHQAYTPASLPVRVEKFPEKVDTLARDSKYLFSEEFKLIQHGASGNRCSYEHSHHPINRDKNRYNNIAAYDHTRVRLPLIDGDPVSDYINANFIDGYAQERAYIATQGPLEGTCDDFWRMCWEENVDTIVMLTGLEENGRVKCYPYWPEQGSSTYGKMTITQTEASHLPKYEIRTFSMLHQDYPLEERFIKHYYFISWPDHGTPHAHELLALIRRVNQGTERSASPVVVHCSAGK